MILIFGILGLVVCAFFAPVAWMMGNADLKEIDAGQMDPEGRDLTNIGRILGIIGSILLIVGCVGGLVMLALQIAVIGGAAAGM